MESMWKDVGTLLLSFLAIGILYLSAWFVISTDNMIAEKNKEQTIENFYEEKSKEQVIEKLYDQGMEGDLYTLSHQASSIFNVILSFFFCVFCVEFAEEIGEGWQDKIYKNVNIQKHKE